MDDGFPPEALLDLYPPPMRNLAEQLRAIVRRTLPEAIERVRPGWRLLAYDIPSGRRSVFCCYVAPEPRHVHLGFQYGVFMRDPEDVLQGRGITKQVRWLTLRHPDEIQPERFAALILEAARVTRLTRAERLLATFADEPERLAETQAG